jgi:phosphoglycolate phosphatase-like HAD superfamily hydrolase
MKLVLFDIDGTILWSDGAGRRAMEGALVAHFGTAGDPAYRYDGKTDRQIAREQLHAAGVPDGDIDARFDALIATYLGNLERELGREPSAARLCDGVDVLLDAVERQAQVVLGLLTGNVEGGAARKLGAVGVDFARFRVNAFGSDHEHRPELPRIAQARARETLGLDVPGERIVIIGDTPADIACGRPIGARAIGVATGRYGVDDLASHEPHAVFADLRDTDRVLEAILA